jgi:hypothetical protein
MNKLAKVCLYTIMAVVVIAVLHVWQNVGFDRLMPKWLSRSEAETTTFKVGFLPVT